MRHHQIVHKKGWTVTRHPDGALTFTDPSDRTTSTWQPPATLADLMPAAGSPATAANRQPASTGPGGSGPDIACQTGNRHTITMRIRTHQRDDGAAEADPESQSDVPGVEENAAPAPPRHAGSPQPWINAHVLSHQMVSKKILNHRVLSFQVAGHDLFSKEVLSNQVTTHDLLSHRAFSYQVARRDPFSLWVFSHELRSHQVLGRAVSAFRLPRSGAHSSTLSDPRKPRSACRLSRAPPDIRCPAV